MVIKEEDLRIDVYSSLSAITTTLDPLTYGVRVTHMPTGVKATATGATSRIAKGLAMTELEDKLKEIMNDSQ